MLCGHNDGHASSENKATEEGVVTSTSLRDDERRRLEEAAWSCEDDPDYTLSGFVCGDLAAYGCSMVADYLGMDVADFEEPCPVTCEACPPCEDDPDYTLSGGVCGDLAAYGCSMVADYLGMDIAEFEGPCPLTCEVCSVEEEGPSCDTTVTYTPVTVTVSNEAELQDAMTSGECDLTINFADSTTPEIVIELNAPLSIIPGAKVTIKGGENNNKVELRAVGAHRNLYVGKGATVHLTGITLSYGVAYGDPGDDQNGGCVFVDEGGTLVASSTTFVGCGALGFGGGISSSYTKGASNITIDANSLVTNCTTANMGGGCVFSTDLNLKFPLLS